MSNTPSLSLLTLGTLQISVCGRPLTGLTAKAQALLVYLAVEADYPHRRESLAGLLWPDQPTAASRNSLRQALHRLRGAMLDARVDLLTILPDTVQIDRASGYTLDVEEFTALVSLSRSKQHLGMPGSLERLALASRLYHGEFLQGFLVRDAAPFDEWMLVKREQLNQMALGMLSALAEAAGAEGDFARMELMARRQLVLDAWYEPAHRQLLIALANSERRNEALAHYEQFRQLLARELGVEPERKTARLRAQIASGDAPAQ